MTRFIKKVIIFCIVSACMFAGGCGQSADENAQLNDVSGKKRIAVIDSGISNRAIDIAFLDEGYNYIAKNSDTEDSYGHGTAVASVILDVNSDVVIVPLVDAVYNKGKITRADGELLAGIIRDAVDVYDCDIINISEGVLEDTDALKNAVEYALSKGAVIVAAVGNDYLEHPDRLYYPAAYDGVISVGALDESGEIADYSQKWAVRNENGNHIKIKLISGNASESYGTSFATAIATGKISLTER